MLSISALLYQTIYLIVVAVLTYLVSNSYTNASLRNFKARSFAMQREALVLTVILVFFIGLRPLSYVFVDMVNYNSHYSVIQGETFEFTWETTNFIFDNIYHAFAANSVPITYFFLLIAAIYFICLHIACSKLFPRDTLLALLVYLGAFSTFSYGTNGIKAGAAASIFLLAIAYRKTIWLSVLFAVISLGFHHSMAMPIAAYVMTFFVKKRQYYFYIWLGCLLAAALHITWFQSLMAGYADESGASYLQVTVEEKSVSGFRPDFILYSAVPIFLGYRLTKKFQIESRTYDFIWCLYTMTNGLWLLCTYAEYTNRIAYLSWLIYPFVLIYPFLNIRWHNRQYTYLKYAIWGHLGFTLFMSFIYY